MASGNKKKDKNNICYCVICKKVADDEAIECTICKGWIHYSCSKLPCYQLTALSSTERLYSCEKCVEVDESILEILESSQSECEIDTGKLSTQEKQQFQLEKQILEQEKQLIEKDIEIKRCKHYQET